MKKVFIIAELSANHNHSIENAIATIRAAKRVGADAIKIQTYTQDTMTIDCKKNDFKIQHGTAWDGQYLYDLYKEAYTPWEWHKELFEAAKDEGITCFSTPFDKTAVDLLESLSCPIYKIASFELTDIPLIEYVASKKKPIIMSTGIATLEEIEAAVRVCKEQGSDDITLLKCTSQYPARPEDANLLTIADMKKRFGVKVGLSDHTMSVEVPMLSVALGAEVIEKHFILDRSIGGPDAHFSLNEEEFATMVRAVRNAEQIIGKVDYEMTPSKEKSRSFSRSLYVVENVKKGEIITEQNVRSIRPGYGLAPKYLKDILGKTFSKDLEKGERMSLEFVEKK